MGAGLGADWFWRTLYRCGLLRARMPLWRVVVEGRPNRAARPWPADVEGAVCAVLVWAHTVEEAEALAQLAVESEGLTPLTADAVKTPPAAPPSREPAVARRSGIVFYGPLHAEPGDPPANVRR